MQIAIEDDRSFCVTQRTFSGVYNPKIRFGPLEAYLSALFNDGFWMEFSGFSKCNRTRFKLRMKRLKARGRGQVIESYVLTQMRLSEARLFENLIEAVPPLCVPLYREPPPEFVRVVEDPLEAIVRRFPIPTPQLMMGNKTLKEYIKEAMVMF